MLHLLLQFRKNFYSSGKVRLLLQNWHVLITCKRRSAPIQQRFRRFACTLHPSVSCSYAGAFSLKRCRSAKTDWLVLYCITQPDFMQEIFYIYLRPSPGLFERKRGKPQNRACLHRFASQTTGAIIPGPNSLNCYFKASVSCGTICFLRDITPFR